MAFERTQIQTDRLLLRPWRAGDVDAAYAYGSDPEWGRYLWNTPFPYNREHAEQFIARAVASGWSYDALWALELDREVVGGIRLYVMDTDAAVAGMGYNLARAHWGKGLTTEAATAVLGYAFHLAGLQKVCSTADARNTGSIRVMEKLGMTHEGTFRRQRLHRGEYVDEVHYGILREERTAANR